MRDQAITQRPPTPQLTQAPSRPCDCGRRAIVMATPSPYEFAWTCRHCGRAGLVSWAHAHPPPRLAVGET